MLNDPLWFPGEDIPEPYRRAIESQELFESLFTGLPKVDVRTPRQVKDQALREGWR